MAGAAFVDCSRYSVCVVGGFCCCYPHVGRTNETRKVYKRPRVIYSVIANRVDCTVPENNEYVVPKDGEQINFEVSRYSVTLDRMRNG